MRKLVTLLSFLMLITACSDKDKVPKSVLSKQQMGDVLWDLLRGDEFLEVYRFPKDSSIDKAAKAQEWYDEIFRLHKTDRSTFEKSYTWYRKHPKVMQEVLDSLSNKTVPSNLPPEQPTVADSSHAIKTDSAQKSVDTINTKPDTASGILLRPHLPRPKLNLDSIRKARTKKFQS